MLGSWTDGGLLLEPQTDVELGLCCALHDWFQFDDGPALEARINGGDGALIPGVVYRLRSGSVSLGRQPESQSSASR